MEGDHGKSLGAAAVELGLQKLPSGFWEGPGLPGPSPQNTRSAFGRRKIPLTAEIRVALFSILFIAPVWLLLWEKGHEEAAERKEEGKRENGGGSGQSWIRMLHTSASCVFEPSLVTWRGFFPKQKGFVPKNLTPPPSRKTHVFVTVVERGRRSGLCARWRQTRQQMGFLWGRWVFTWTEAGAAGVRGVV